MHSYTIVCSLLDAVRNNPTARCILRSEYIWKLCSRCSKDQENVEQVIKVVCLSL